MSEQAEQVIVLRDGAGAYYAIPLTAVAMYRVPEEHWDELAARFVD